MIYRATSAEIHEYKHSPRVSQSYLKKVVLRGKATDVKFVTQVMGDVVDLHLTHPDSEDDFIAVYSGTVPPEPMQVVLIKTIEYLFETNRITSDLNDHRHFVMLQAGYEEYCVKTSREKLWAKIVNDGHYWWQFQVENLGKTVVSHNERSFAVTIAEKAKKHPVTAPYFPEYDIQGRDFYYQLPLYFEFEGVECKGLVDQVIVSHVKRQIIVHDIKTAWETSRNTLFEQIRSNRYVFQLSFYAEAIKQFFSDLIDQGYTLSCGLIFIPKNVKNFHPEIVPVTEKMLQWEKYGGKISGRIYENESPPFKFSSGYEVRGWVEALRLYKEVRDKNLTSFNVQSTLPISPAESESMFFV